MVGRFQVMALLQAARATVLGYSQDEAESFGLNRAIFYAAAKRAFMGNPARKEPTNSTAKHPLRRVGPLPSTLVLSARKPPFMSRRTGRSGM